MGVRAKRALIEEQKTFGRYVAYELKKARRLKKIHQHEVAEWLGVSPAVYCRKEMGDAKLAIDEIFAVCHLLEVDIARVIAQARTRFKKEMAEEKRRGLPWWASRT